MTPKDEWLTKISAAVGRVGTPEARAAFSEAVFQSLGGGLPAAVRAEWRHEHTQKLAATSVNARNAFLELKAMMDDGVLMARQLHSESERIGQRDHARRDASALWSADAETLSSYFSAFASRAARLLERLPNRRRGKSTIIASTLAAGIAIAYRQHFGRDAACAKRGPLAKPYSSPFDRVCLVVEQLLKSLNYDARFTESAKRTGIERARACRVLSRQKVGQLSENSSVITRVASIVQKWQHSGDGAT